MIKNQIKTVLLLGLLTGVLLGAGHLLGGRQGLIIGLAFAFLMNFGSYWFSDKIVLAMYRAKAVGQNDRPVLYKIVKEVTGKAGIPMPKVYVVPAENPNAFATGRNPSNASIACTEGILNLLSEDELRGVIAHEVAHIKNRDILIQTVAATIAGVISYLAFMAKWGAIFGGFGGREGDRGGLIGLLALAIVTPLIAMIIQFAISRSREYLADETGGKIIKNPGVLANALEKLDLHGKERPMRFGSEATSCLFIANPFSARGALHLLSTHPPMKRRISKLRNMEV